MDQELTLEEPNLDSLLEPTGPAAPAWLTRVHWHLAQHNPRACVVRFGHSLDNLTGWLDAEEVLPDKEAVLSYLGFDEDRDAPRRYAEGGCLAFSWRGWTFRTVSVRSQGPRRPETHTWLIAPHRAAAEALVDAVGRHASGRRARLMVFEDGSWEEAPRLEVTLGSYSWESLVLPGDARERIRGAAERFFRSERVYRELGIPWKVGFLLVGPPGTGKTLTTKVLAQTCSVPFLYVRGLNSFSGSEPDAGTVREMFQGARDRAPCTLCLEDIDSLVTQPVQSAFLNELDGLEEDYRGVLVVATTNHPERLDPALLQRPCRFDYRFEFPLPDEDQRREFVRHWMERLAALGYLSGPGAGIESIVRRTRGMSHAYLKRVLVGAALRMQHLEERGDEAFARLVLEEVADAAADRSLAHRAAAGVESLPARRVGFRQE